MKRKHAPFLFAVALLVLLPAVSAVELVPQNTCSCGLTTESLRIVNEASEKHSFSVSVEGDASSFAVVYPPSFTLPPGGYIDVTVDIHFPCLKNKAYSAFIVVKSDDGSVKKFPKAYFARECPNIQLRTYSASRESGPCKPATFRFDVTNAAPYDDYFTFKVLPTEYSDFVSVNSQKVHLKPRQTHTLFITTNFPCNVSGEKNFTLITKTEKSNLMAVTPFSLRIIPDYNFDVAVEDSSVSVCKRLSKEISLSVSNRNDFSQSFSLSLINAPSWVSLSSETLSLGPSESSHVKLRLNPPDYAGGNYNFSVVVSSDYGNASKSVPVSVDVRNCYDFSLYFDFPERVCCDSGELRFVLLNNGTKAGSFNLSLVSPEGLSLPSSVYLEAGSAKDIRAVINECPSEASDVKVRVTPVNAPSLARTFSRGTSFFTGGNCSRLVLLKKNFDISYSDYSLEIPVMNAGAKPTYYYLNLVSGSWEHLETFDFVLAPGEEASVKLYLDPEGVPEDTYALELVATAPSGQEFRLPFFLTLRKKFSVSDILWSVYVSASSNPCGFSYRALLFVFVSSLVLVLLFSALKSRSRRIKSVRFFAGLVRFFAYLSFVAVLGVGIAFLFCNYGLSSITTYVPSNFSTPPAASEPSSLANESVNATYNASSESEVGFTLEIPPTGVFEWDLSEVFRDPDADVLYYTIISPPSLDVKVNNEKRTALIKPLPGFKEGSTLTVIVSDGEYTVSSPPIRVMFDRSGIESSKKSKNSESAGETSFYAGRYVFIVLLLVVTVLFIRVLLARRGSGEERSSVLARKYSVSDLRGPDTPKRKRGRPKGSKNKKKRGKRGRPKKSQ